MNNLLDDELNDAEKLLKLLSRDETFEAAVVDGIRHRRSRMANDTIQAIMFDCALHENAELVFRSHALRVIATCICARDRFRDGGKIRRTPGEHKKHYTRIYDLATELRSLLESEDGYWGVDMGFEQAEWLSQLAESASDAATNQPQYTQRPNAAFADRTFAIKELSRDLRNRLGEFRHEAVASVVNVVFPEYEPIDGIYVQGIARRIKKFD